MRPLGVILIVATTLYPAWQLASLPDIRDQVALFSQYLGLGALVLMAWAQILSTRLPGLEVLFGGLDRIYVLHKWAGIAAMAAILLHDTIDAEIDGVGRETALTEFAETLGELSLYGLLILVVLSVATFVPYHLWKWTHKLMGALFAAGAFHFVFILKPFAMADPAGLYTGLFCLAGLLAYAWSLLPENARRSHAYVIESVDHSGGAVAISMAPKARGIRPEPGQFAVLRFTGAGKAEPHPFSFSHIGDNGNLRVSIKALGDFTSSLGKVVKPGQDLRLQGPFGRFRLPRKGAQVWIAGGIGITPFLAWGAALAQNADPVHLFYCIRSRGEAPHLDEIEAIAAAHPAITLHLIISGEGARLDANMIAEHVGADLANATVSFCGPVPLRRALQTGLRRHGISPRRFHYEEFEFRTGIGLERLAAIVLKRGLRSARMR